MPEITLVVDGEPVRLLVERDGDAWIVRGEAAAGGGPGDAASEQRLALTVMEPGVVRMTVGDRAYLIRAVEAGAKRALHVDGHTLEYEVAPPVGSRSARVRAAERDLTAPMPGVVTQVLVHDGEAVTAGQALVIVEAMKMEHVVRALRAGIVKAVRVRQGEQVESGAVVAEMGPPE